MDRRDFTRSVLLAGFGMAMCSNGAHAEDRKMDKPEESEELVTPNEDLMREHGVLERVLLIYEEARRRGQAGELPVRELRESSEIVRHFIEDYHEKLEENYVFPRFEKANRLVDLVRTLRSQHDAGRQITTEMLRLTDEAGTANASRLDTLMGEFIRMYRPHYAREDTVLFPAFPDVAGTKEYRELGEAFEDQEHKLFGESGFAGIVDKVAAIEKRLGTNELAQFTPKR